MNIDWQCTDSYFCLGFERPVRALSSSILNGGFGSISGFINMRVDENFKGRKTDFPPPEETIARTAACAGLPSDSAGMMTAASMNSFQYSADTRGGVSAFCWLTSGLSNSLAAGDPGEFFPQQMFSEPEYSRTGTINIVMGTNLPLTDSALAEALIVVTEAKSSVLFELGVKSIISDRSATGTGTDSALVFCNGEGGSLDDSRNPEQYCGKHTVLGEMFAGVVRSALFESLKNDRLFR